MLLGAVPVVARDRGEDPVPVPEIVPLGVATFTLAKLLAKERVAAEVRGPFIEETQDGRRPKGEGLRYAVGELLTCTRSGSGARRGSSGCACCGRVRGGW